MKKNIALILITIMIFSSISYATSPSQKSDLYSTFEKRIALYGLDTSKFLNQSEFTEYLSNEGFNLISFVENKQV